MQINTENRNRIKTFVELLNALGMSEKTAMGIILTLKDEEQMYKMVDWIEEHPTADEQEMTNQAIAISGRKTKGD